MINISSNLSNIQKSFCLPDILRRSKIRNQLNPKMGHELDLKFENFGIQKLWTTMFKDTAWAVLSCMEFWEHFLFPNKIVVYF